MPNIFLLEIYDSCERYVVKQYAFSSRDKAIAKACQIEESLFLDWKRVPTLDRALTYFHHAESRKYEDQAYHIRELTVD